MKTARLSEGNADLSRCGGFRYGVFNNIVSPTGPAGNKRANPTGYFGTLTKNALALYQAKAGISPASGIMGPKTRAYLESIGPGNL